MGVALGFREEDWWPFPQEAVTDLLAFFEDSEGYVEVPPVAVLAPVANDNWPLHIERAGVNELPAIVIWNPRYRTVD